MKTHTQSITRNKHTLQKDTNTPHIVTYYVDTDKAIYTKRTDINILNHTPVRITQTNVQNP